jgi:hypothetical protein
MLDNVIAVQEQLEDPVARSKQRDGADGAGREPERQPERQPAKENVLDGEDVEVGVEATRNYITIRAKPQFVTEVSLAAETLGLSVSAFVRMACKKEIATQRRQRGQAD